MAMFPELGNATSIKPKAEARIQFEIAESPLKIMTSDFLASTASTHKGEDALHPQRVKMQGDKAMLPLTAPATPGIVTPASTEEVSLSLHTQNDPQKAIHQPTSNNIEHFPPLNPPNTKAVPNIPDTPRSLSPQSKEDAFMLNSAAPSHSACLPDASPHAESLWREGNRIAEIVSKNEGEYKPVLIDFERSIGLAEIIAVSKHGIYVDVKDAVAAIKRVSASVDFLQDQLQDGHSLYGITTGFGGSANTRTTKTYDLQSALLQHQQSGILPVVKKPGTMHAKLRDSPSVNFMPEEWVRGAMLIRCKSLLNGYSAIRWEPIAVLMMMLNKNLIPLVPLRGSISASGDLQPLSYIAGAMEGNPDIWVWTDDGYGGRDLIPSDAALAKFRVIPQKFGPKEGLAVLNGTAFSSASAALVLHEAHNVAVLSQVLTAMGVEALLAAVGSFDPFLAKVRAHRGQAEAARNIRHFVQGSCLARNEDEAENEKQELKQDRYAIRTASQWIGPQLEDLVLAHEQISVELNSTTDNPLFNIEDNTVHHGGNFQAVSVTSAMEKTRLSLQMLGRMLFSQCSELINTATSNGLPPNLAADEPSTSYTFKGIDINIAAYISELGYLANPVSSHVQAAEMGNQGINSLALISARYTHQAVDTLSMLCAAYLYSLCQALDLRVMNHLFEENAVREIQELTYEAFEYVLKDGKDVTDLQAIVVEHILKQIPETISIDSTDRFQRIARTAQGAIFTFLGKLDSARLSADIEPFGLIREWNIRCSERLRNIFVENRKGYFSKPDASPYLGKASFKMYNFVRNVLQVPFHKGLVDRPSKVNHLRSIGSNASVIYEALRDGKLYEQMMGLLNSENPVVKIATDEPSDRPMDTAC